MEYYFQDTYCCFVYDERKSREKNSAMVSDLRKKNLCHETKASEIMAV
jgi:hypothetical protein